MPTLLYGKLSPREKRGLFGIHLQSVELIWSMFKIKGLAPAGAIDNTALIWHLTESRHSCLAYHAPGLGEHSIFLPGLHEQRDVIMLAREAFGGIVPGPMLFRVLNEGETYDIGI